MDGPGDRRSIRTAHHADIPNARKQPACGNPRRGCGETAILRRFRAGDPTLPASHFHPLGELRVFADKAAAGG